MHTLNNQRSKINTGLILVSCLYFVFIIIYSVNQYDLGFILSFVKRIEQGQVIYKDFDYVRPFFGVAFWDYLLYIIPSQSNYLILFSRIFVILESLIIVLLIQKIFSDKIKISVSVLLTVCFLHSFPIMPWHTIDGILFSVLSIFFFKKKYILSSLIFILFACLTKQSFFIFGIGFSIITIVNQYRDFKLKKQDIYIFMGFLLFFIIILYQYHLIENIKYFLSQVLYSSASSGFYSAAVKPYLFDKTFENILFLSLLIILCIVKIKIEIIDYCLTAIFTILMIIPFLNNGTYLFIHQIYVILLVLFIKYKNQNKLIYLLFFVGWSSSISWGYNNPAFFIFILIYNFLHQKNKYIYFLWSLSLFSLFFYRIKYTYLSDNILDSKYIFTKNISAVSGLLISEKENNYISEAQKLNQEYKNLIFVPGSPLLDLINHNFPNRASWEMDVEYPNWQSDADSLKTHVIAVDNMQSYKEGFYKSSFTKTVISNKKIIKKTKSFTIYGN